jgi:hypothetical protein
MFRRIATVALSAAVALGLAHAAAPDARVRVIVSEQTRTHMLENLAYATSLPQGEARQVAERFATSYVLRFDARGTHGIAGSLA